MDNYVWRVGLAKTGRNKIFKELTFIADTFFDLAHIIASEVYESDMFPDEDVTVMYMKRAKGLGKIVNYGEDEGEGGEWSGNEPLEMAKNMPDERVMNFKCVCHEELRVADFNWPFVKCHNCENKIFRREVSSVGGIVIYSRIESLHKDDKE